MIHQILDQKRKEVAAREKAKPLTTFVENIKPTRLSIEYALKQKQPGFILECKKASPSKGLIRADFDLDSIVKTYAPFASAISVLTDEAFFQGRLDFIAQARANFDGPILCKDFMLSPYQVYEARHYGADAILLMLSVLDDASYKACAHVASTLGMDVLTEVHDEIELQRALSLGANLIGINNRNFKTLEVDLNVSRKLIPLIPQDKTIVLESGFSSHGEIVEFQNKVSGFLVGTSLMQQPRLDLAVRELIFGRVKICGLTSIADAQMVYDAGASLGGLIFAKESPRFISPEKAREIAHKVPLRFVGVFVNEELSVVSGMARDLNLFAVQLHGDESPTYVEELKSLLPQPTQIWKAFRIKDALSDFQNFKADRFLLDAYSAEQRGGTGQVFNWNLLRDFPERNKIILSGGLSPQNITQADRLGVFALDVNSKVEQAPGVKSQVLVKELFRGLLS